MSFVAANTDPKVGWRNYNTNPRAAAHLSGLGDATSLVSAGAPASVATAAAIAASKAAAAQQSNAIESYLQQSFAELQSMEQAVAANPGVYDAAFTANLNEAIALYNQCAQTYISAYTTIFGTPPSVGTLSGLGITWTTIIAMALTGPFAILIPLFNELDSYIAALTAQQQALLAQAQSSGVQAQTALDALTQYNSLVNAANDAAAGGDTATYDNLMAQAQALAPIIQNAQAGAVATAPGTPPAATDWTTWFENNFSTIALAGAAIFLAPPLISAFSGKRR